MKKILTVFATHGFQGFAERAKLGRFIVEKFSPPHLQHKSTEHRLRLAFEQLGPTFIKLGQLLASRPDLIPETWAREFRKLQTQVSPCEFGEIEQVLNEHFKTSLTNIFSDFNQQPFAAASIAQVHKARLRNGDHVVVKIQRPHIERIIQEDLDVLHTLAEALEKYVEETRLYSPVNIVKQFAKSLKLETNFIVEANNMRRIRKNFKDEEKIKIPFLYQELSGRKVLVMEEIHGLPLSSPQALEQSNINREEILKIGLNGYLKMIFTHGLFHGDLHPGNILVLSNNQLALIDFGVVGRLGRQTQLSIASILTTLVNEDYDRLAYEYLDLTPYAGHIDVDKLAHDLRDLIAPYYGLTLQDVNLGKILMSSATVAAQHRLTLPSELILFFKSLISTEALGRLLAKDFDFLSHYMSFVQPLMRTHYSTSKIGKDLAYTVRDVNALLSHLPRQLRQVLRRLNNPNLAIKMQVRELYFLKRSIDNSANIIFLGLVIGSCILGASALYVADMMAARTPTFSLIGYGIAAVLGLVAFVNYIKK